VRQKKNKEGEAEEVEEEAQELHQRPKKRYFYFVKYYSLYLPNKKMRDFKKLDRPSADFKKIKNQNNERFI
jgi:hypothetical protein